MFLPNTLPGLTVSGFLRAGIGGMAGGVGTPFGISACLSDAVGADLKTGGVEAGPGVWAQAEPIITNADANGSHVGCIIALSISDVTTVFHFVGRLTRRGANSRLPRMGMNFPVLRFHPG